MTEDRYQKAMRNIANAFATPQDIADASDLSAREKIELLRQWEFDLRQLQVASEEGMTSGKADGTATTLRAVHLLLERFGARKGEKAAVNKAGG